MTKTAMTLTGPETSHQNRELKLLLGALVLSHLGWAKFLIPDAIFAIDYGLRIALVVAYVWVLGRPDLNPRQLFHSLFAILFVTFAVLGAEGTYDRLLLPWWPREARLGGFPEIESIAFKIIDLTIGLVLVAVSEELVYRRLVTPQLDRLRLPEWMVYVASALIFAELHAVQGPISFMSAFWAGLGLHYLYRSSGGVLAPIVAHYLINLWFFSGLPPLFYLFR